MIQKIHNSNGLSCPLRGQIIEVLLYCIYSIIVHFITIVLILCGKASFIVPSDEPPDLAMEADEGDEGGGDHLV